MKKPTAYAFVVSILLTLANSGCATAQVARAPAGGGIDTGGGSYVRVDGNLTLADDYYKLKGAFQSRPFGLSEFPEELNKYINQMVSLLIRLEFDKRLPIDEIIAGRYQYVTAEEFKQVPCPKYLPDTTIPVEEKFQFGCTVDGKTYLIRELFQKANLRQQARAILHERLWAYNRSAHQADISDFVAGMGVLLQKIDDQILRHDRTPLNEAQMIKLNALYPAARKLGLYLYKRLTPIASENGAFITGESDFASVGRISKNSFIGAGTLLDGTVRIADSTVINSVVRDAYVSGSETNDAELVHSTVTDSKVEASSVFFTKLRSSQLSYSGIYGVGRAYSDSDRGQAFASDDSKNNFRDRSDPKNPEVSGAVLDHSDLTGLAIKATKENPTAIRNSEIHARDDKGSTIGSNVRLVDVEIKNLPEDTEHWMAPETVSLGDGTSLENVRIFLSINGDLKSDPNTDIKNLTYKNTSRGLMMTSQKTKLSGSRDFEGMSCVSDDSNVKIDAKFQCR